MNINETTKLFGNYSLSVRPLEIGESWQMLDIINCSKGLIRVPARLIGCEIKHIQSRDIFLRPNNPPANMTHDEWEKEWDNAKYE